MDNLESIDNTMIMDFWLSLRDLSENSSFLTAAINFSSHSLNHGLIPSTFTENG